MSKFDIPYPMSGNDAPINISFMVENEKSAGKYGFLKVNGDHFELEDGTPGRLWGVCINASANFPEQAHQKKLESYAPTSEGDSGQVKLFHVLSYSDQLSFSHTGQFNAARYFLTVVIDRTFLYNMEKRRRYYGLSELERTGAGADRGCAPCDR